MIYKMIKKFAAAKPATPTTPAKRLLASASEDKAFFVHGGGALRNLNDLRNALQTMSKEVFAYHVNKERNDFATWVDDVFSERDLSKRINQLKTRGSALNAVTKYLREVYSL